MNTSVVDSPAAETAQAEPLDPTVELLMEMGQATLPRRREIEQELVRLHMPMARGLAKRYAGRGLAMDDLIQVAYLGLVKAVRGFDPARGHEFYAYAVPTVRGELRRHFRDAGWVVRPPRRLQELQAQLWAAEAELTQELHRSPTAAEIAEMLDVTEEDILEALATDGCFAPSSLDAPTPDGEGSVGDRLGDEDDEFDGAEARIVLAEALATLGDRERRIVELRFFEGWTQQQIGDEIGVSQMQVSRILTKILGQLRTQISGDAA
jgi:RNA polymerase sigma-B factor